MQTTCRDMRSRAAPKMAALSLPVVHPLMSNVFRQRLTTPAAGLEHSEQRDGARLALRGFLEKIIGFQTAMDYCGSWEIRDR